MLSFEIRRVLIRQAGCWGILIASLSIGSEGASAADCSGPVLITVPARVSPAANWGGLAQAVGQNLTIPDNSGRQGHQVGIVSIPDCLLVDPPTRNLAQEHIREPATLSPSSSRFFALTVSFGN